MPNVFVTDTGATLVARAERATVFVADARDIFDVRETVFVALRPDVVVCGVVVVRAERATVVSVAVRFAPRDILSPRDTMFVPRPPDDVVSREPSARSDVRVVGTTVVVRAMIVFVSVADFPPRETASESRTAPSAFAMPIKHAMMKIKKFLISRFIQVNDNKNMPYWKVLFIHIGAKIY